MQRFIDGEKLMEVCSHYEISTIFTEYLRQMIDYKIVIIADDSGSMKTLTSNNESRWNELYRFVHMIFSVTQIMVNNPLDIYFLNRPSILSVQSLESISNSFLMDPNGFTPIVPILKHVLQQPYYGYQGRIIIIATDGEPTDQYNKVNITELYHSLMNDRTYNDYITFLACTDDDNAIGYLNKWDRQIPRVDVVDDYHSEKKEVLAVQGRRFSFTYGDYVVKTVMGCVVPELDKLDETRLEVVDGMFKSKDLLYYTDRHEFLDYNDEVLYSGNSMHYNNECKCVLL